MYLLTVGLHCFSQLMGVSLTISPYFRINLNNESTAGADASVEMPKLHNIKLLFPISCIDSQAVTVAGELFACTVTACESISSLDPRPSFRFYNG